MRNEWAERLEAERNGFVDDLVSRGFRLVGAGPEPRLVGELTYPPNADAVAVEISLPEGWPYRSTKVRPTAWSEPLSWHQEANGALCLFPTSTAGLPWADPEQLLERVARWFRQAAAGWPDDEPDLDLERYFESAVDEEFLVYDGVQSLLGKQIKVGHGRHGIRELRASGKSAARRVNRGWALDLGELAAPSPHLGPNPRALGRGRDERRSADQKSRSRLHPAPVPAWVSRRRSRLTSNAQGG